MRPARVADVTLNGYGSGDWADYNSLFLDLGTELDAMPNLNSALQGAPFAKTAATWEGRILGVPGINTGLMANSSDHLLINKKWLDKLGLPIPTTWSELKTTLEAFRDGDPTGTGAQVTPFNFLPPSTSGWGTFNPSALLSSFGITTTEGAGNGMYAEDGVVRNFLTDPRYKELLSYLNELWNEGLISKDAFTQDFSKYISGLKGNGDVASVGMTIWWTPSDGFGSQLADQYVAIPSLTNDSAPSAKKTWYFNGDTLNYFPNRVAVSANAKNKDAALRIVDAFYTPDIGIQARYGSFGVGVTKNGEKNYTVLPPADTTKNASDWQFQNSLGDGAPGWFVQPGVTLTLPKEQFEVRGVDAVYNDDYANIDLNRDVLYNGVSFTADEAREYSLNDTGISQTAMSMAAQWITKGGIDQDWDSYVEGLENNKLDRQIELKQAAYDRFVDVMQQNKVDLNSELNNPNLQFTQNSDGTATISNNAK